MAPEEPVVESAGTVAGTSIKPASSATAARELDWLALLLGAMVWPVVIGIIVSIFSATFRTFVAKWWWAFAIAFACVLIIGLLPAGRRKLVKLPFTTQAALIFFVGL